MLRDKLYFEELVNKVESLVIFRNISKDKIIRELLDVAKLLSFKPEANKINDKYYGFISMLIRNAEKYGDTGNLLKRHVIRLFLNDVNIYSLACEHGKVDQASSMKVFALKDIVIFKALIEFDLKNLCEYIGKNEAVYASYAPNNKKPAYDNSYIDKMYEEESINELLDSLTWHYTHMGCGETAGQFSLICDVRSGSPILKALPEKQTSFDHIFGIETQKETILYNTERFIKGSKASNLVLVGVQGTGKRTCIRALAGQKGLKNLKVIEISKNALEHVPELIETLSKHNRNFILCIKNLGVVSDYDMNILEQISEITDFLPKNVLVYATADLSKSDSEVWHKKISGESIQETQWQNANGVALLNDIFGSAVYFPTLSDKDFMKLVLSMAKKEKIMVSEDFLTSQALEWKKSMGEVASSRVASKFLNAIAWELSKN
jgi:hypothetical protein